MASDWRDQHYPTIRLWGPQETPEIGQLLYEWITGGHPSIASNEDREKFTHVAERLRSTLLEADRTSAWIEPEAH